MAPSKEELERTREARRASLVYLGAIAAAALLVGAFTVSDDAKNTASKSKEGLYVAGSAVPFFVALLRLLSRPEASIAQSGLVGYVVGVGVWAGIAVLFGAPVLGLWGQTLSLASILSGLTFLPVSLEIHHSAGLLEDFRAVLVAPYDVSVELDAAKIDKQWSQRSVRRRSLGAALGAWLGALPIPLDWDTWWQAYPISIVFGALAGASLAAALEASGALDVVFPKKLLVAERKLL